MKLKNLMRDCLEVRGYTVTEEQLNELYEIYEDCQEWDYDKMLTGNSYEDVEDFVKHSSSVDEMLSAKKQWYKVMFCAELSEDDRRSMNKYFYDAMEQSMDIGPCSDLSITLDDKKGEMSTERKAELFDKAIEWVWEHTNAYGVSEYLAALKQIGYSKQEIANEITSCNFDDDHPEDE